MANFLGNPDRINMDGLFRSQPQGTDMGFDPNNFNGQQNNQGSLAQIFNGMLGAQQGIPQMLAQNQMGAYNQFGNNMQNNMAQIGQQNNANAGNAMGLAGLRAGLQGKRMDDSTSLAQQQLKMPMMAGLLGALTGGSFPGLGAGGLRGFSSTNSPQAASLPPGVGGGGFGGTGGAAGGFGGGALFNAIMGSQPLAPGAFGSSVNVMDALANPADNLRKQQLANFQAGLHHTAAIGSPTDLAGASQVNLGNIF